jgi:hypothetical protein
MASEEELKAAEVEAELAALRLTRLRAERKSEMDPAEDQPSQRKPFNLEQVMQDLKNRTGIS